MGKGAVNAVRNGSETFGRVRVRSAVYQKFGGNPFVASLCKAASPEPKRNAQHLFRSYCVDIKLF